MCWWITQSCYGNTYQYDNLLLMYDVPVCVGGLLKVAMTYQYDNLLLMHAISVFTYLHYLPQHHHYQLLVVALL